MLEMPGQARCLLSTKYRIIRVTFTPEMSLEHEIWSCVAKLQNELTWSEQKERQRSMMMEWWKRLLLGLVLAAVAKRRTLDKVSSGSWQSLLSSLVGAGGGRSVGLRLWLRERLWLGNAELKVDHLLSSSSSSLLPCCCGCCCVALWSSSRLLAVHTPQEAGGALQGGSTGQWSSNCHRDVLAVGGECCWYLWDDLLLWCTLQSGSLVITNWLSLLVIGLLANGLSVNGLLVIIKWFWSTYRGRLDLDMVASG